MMLQKNIGIKSWFVSVLGLVIGISSPAFAANAQVTITAVINTGGSLQGAQIQCLDTPPDNNGWPQPPKFTYLVTDTNGHATWTVQIQAGHTYNCFRRSVYTVDGCHQIQNVNKTFDFQADSSQSVTVIGEKTTSYICPPRADSPTSTTTAQTEVSMNKPAVIKSIKLTKILAAGNEVTVPKDSTTPVVITQGGEVVLRGTSSGVTKVVVKVFSDPKSFSVPVNSKGAWELKIATNDLTSGSHKIEVSGSGATKPITTLALQVNPFPVPVQAPEQSPKSRLWLNTLLAILVFLVGGMSFIVIRKLRGKNVKSSASRSANSTQIVQPDTPEDATKQVR